MAADPNLVSFIQAQLQASVPKEQIEKTLTTQGWAPTAVQEAFTQIESGVPVPPSPTMLPSNNHHDDVKETSTGAAIATILALVFLFPVGIVLLWTITHWAKWVKWLITIIVSIIPVLTILGILAISTLIAINPQKQFQQANDTQRQNDVNEILNAINQYTVDQNGQLPSGITASETAISSTGVDLCAALVPEYLATLPSDPLGTNNGVSITDCASAYDTGYTVSSSGNNQITVSAPNAEQAESISATR